jgi:hypothetical protein
MGHDPFVPQLAPTRSTMPRMVGILAITFACIGFALAVLFTAGPLHDLRHTSDKGSADLWMYAFAGLSLLLFALHLAGGILAAGYRTIGLRLLTGYAVGALALVAIDLVYVLAIVPQSSRVVTSLVKPHLVYSLCAIPWPVVVLVLVNLPRSKRMCR